MNKTAIAKHDIYHKLSGFSEKDLHAITRFIDSMRQKSNMAAPKPFKLQGILAGYDITPEELKQCRHAAWEHLEQKLAQ